MLRSGARIAIVGGGPGGLTTAHTLLTTGFKPSQIRIFERASQYAPASGGGFGIAFNSLRVMHALGMDGIVQPLCAPIQNWALLDGAKPGAPVQKIQRNIAPLAPMTGYGTTGLPILAGALRAEVLGALAASLPAGILQLDREVLKVEAQGSADAPARLRIGPARQALASCGHAADGSDGGDEVSEFDVVVASDGIRSRIRDAVLPDCPPPTYSGAEIFYGVAADPGIIAAHEWAQPGRTADAGAGPTGSDFDSGWCVQAPGCGAYFISAPCRIVNTRSAFPSLASAAASSLPFSPGVYYGFVRRTGAGRPEARESWTSLPGGSTARASTPAPAAIGGPQTVGPATGDAAASGDAHKEELMSVVGDGAWGQYARDLVQATPPGRMLRFGMHFRPALPRWHAGRVVLLGDAAHAPLPSVGQGFNMAIEDGFALGTALAAALRPIGAVGEDGQAAASGRSDTAVGSATAQAFAAYEGMRQGKTNAMVQLSRQLLTVECGIGNPFFASLRTRLLGVALGKMVSTLRDQIDEAPVVTPAALRELQKSASTA